MATQWMADMGRIEADNAACGMITARRREDTVLMATPGRRRPMIDLEREFKVHKGGVFTKLCSKMFFYFAGAPKTFC